MYIQVDVTKPVKEVIKDICTTYGMYFHVLLNVCMYVCMLYGM